jgi:hypothetical protein
MSKLKTPREKKLASLAMDRRNVVAEHPHASRNGIPRSKQLSHKAQRRASKKPLTMIVGASYEDDITALELQARERELESKLSAFKKTPDAPVGQILEARRQGESRFQYWKATE